MDFPIHFTVTKILICLSDKIFKWWVTDIIKKYTRGDLFELNDDGADIFFE